MSRPEHQTEARPGDPPEAMTEAVIILFRTARTCMLPFFLAGANGDSDAATSAILQMVTAYNFATPMELDLASRIITFNAAAMDSLRLSMQPDLSDSSVSKHRAAAIGLDRSAEQCRKVLQALQANRRPRPAQSTAAQATPAQPMPAQPRPTQAAASHPKPASAPAPESPSAPPRPTPPAQPQPKSASQPTLVTPTSEGDFDFEIQIETMRRNALAMIADLEAMADNNLEAEHPAAEPAPLQTNPIRPDSAASS